MSNRKVITIPDITKKTAAQITDLTDYSIEIGKESDLNKRSYGLLLSQLQILLTGATGYMEYYGLFTQSLTGAPTIKYTLINTFGELPVISRDGDGDYNVSINGVTFLQSNTFINLLLEEAQSQAVIIHGGVESGIIKIYSYVDAAWTLGDSGDFYISIKKII